MEILLKYRFSQVRSEWTRLFTHTPEVSPFLSPEAMAIAVKYFYPYYFQRRCRPVFAVFIENKSVIAIVPLLKLKSGNYELFGFPNGFNEAGMVYSDAARLSKCFSLMRKELGTVKLLKIDERSPLARFINGESDEVSNAAIYFGDCFEDYFSSLSKSVRQNIRTAYNRIKTDGATFKLKTFKGGDKSFPLSEIIELYCRRHAMRYGVKTGIIKRWFLTYQSFATRYYRFCSNSLTTVLYINDKPVAFMSGLVNESRMIVPRLSINGEFNRYSPGMILICETIKNLIDNSGIRVLDLSQGNETYKFQLGAQKHMTYSFTI